jgi:ABC-type antimicrobial peptide transport system permease subunit
MALGASRGAIAGLVAQWSAVLVVAGLAVGVSIAWLLSRTVEAFLFQIEPGDARVFAAAVGVLALTGLAAAIVPARRASGIDPLVALRE